MSLYTMVRKQGRETCKEKKKEKKKKKRRKRSADSGSTNSGDKKLSAGMILKHYQ